MEYENQDYYALINYRGRNKYYKVLKRDGKDILVNYIDYDIRRQHDRVWISNGIDRIEKYFYAQSPEYLYFESLRKCFIEKYNMLVMRNYDESDDKSLPDIFYHAGIGTHNIYKAYIEAFKETPNPNNILF